MRPLLVEVTLHLWETENVQMFVEEQAAAGISFHHTERRGNMQVSVSFLEKFFSQCGCRRTTKNHPTTKKKKIFNNAFWKCQINKIKAAFHDVM